MKPSVSVHEKFEATEPPDDVRSWIKQFSVEVQQSDELFCATVSAMEYTGTYLESAPTPLDYIEYPMKVKGSTHVIELQFHFYQSRDDSDDLLFDIKCYKDLEEIDGLFGYGPILDEVEQCYELSSDIFLGVVDGMFHSNLPWLD